MHNSLRHIWTQLAARHSLTIAYFGGSITEGAGASDSEKTSWRALTTRWFKVQYPAAIIREVNAALGGTGSDLGVFRLAQEVIVHLPDLVFIEFAVNDSDTSSELLSRSMEGIVRHLRRELPRSEIVFVYTTSKGMHRSDALPPRTVALHEQIASYYGVPSVDVGEALERQIQGGGGTWDDFTRDGVHPTDAGYALYAAAMREFLVAQRDAACRQSPPSPSEPQSLPSPLEPSPLENGRFVPAGELDAAGWQLAREPLAALKPEWHPERYATVLVSNEAGQEVRYEFNGSALGLMWLVAPDSGDVEYSIDGSAPGKLSSWDRFAREFTRPNYCILSPSLEPGKHELVLRILPEHHEQSRGTWIRLLGLLINTTV